MINRIDLVQNDTGPTMLLTIKDANTGLPLDFSVFNAIPPVSGGIEFHLSLGSDAAAKAVIPMFLGPNPANGEVILDWATGNTNALDTAGICFGEVQITWPDGRIQTTPERLKFRIREEQA